MNGPFPATNPSASGRLCDLRKSCYSRNGPSLPVYTLRHTNPGLILPVKMTWLVFVAVLIAAQKVVFRPPFDWANSSCQSAHRTKHGHFSYPVFIPISDPERATGLQLT